MTPKQTSKSSLVLSFKKELLFEKRSKNFCSVAPAKGERGFALLIVLWTLVLLALLTAQVTGAGRSEAVMATALRQSAQLQQAADGAVYETIYHMLNGSGDYWPPGSFERDLAEPGAHVRVVVEDERGKLDLNQVPVPLIAGLFLALGVDSATAQNAATGIADWRSQAAPGDALESVPAEYRMDGFAYGPPGQEIERLDELLLVRGMTPALYQASLPYFTLALEQGPWLQYASPTVLNAIARAKRNAGVTVDDADTRGPVVLQMTAEADGPDGTRFIRHVLFRLDGSLSGPDWKYRILSWD